MVNFIKSSFLGHPLKVESTQFRWGVRLLDDYSSCPLDRTYTTTEINNS